MFQASDSPCLSSLAGLFQHLQTESNILKCLAQIKSLPPGDMVGMTLYEIEGVVSNIEQRLDEFNEFLDSELETCNTIECEIIQRSLSQNMRIEEFENSLLREPKIKDNSFVEKGEKPSNANDLNKYLISQKELDAIPKTIRSRLTVGIVSGALGILKSMINKKSKVLIFSSCIYISNQEYSL